MVTRSGRFVTICCLWWGIVTLVTVHRQSKETTHDRDTRSIHFAHGQCAKTERVECRPKRSGHSRAAYNFDGFFCYLESVGFSTYSGVPRVAAAVLMTVRKPRSWWWTDYEMEGKERCETLAKRHNGRIEEAFYRESLCFR